MEEATQTTQEADVRCLDRLPPDADLDLLKDFVSQIRQYLESAGASLLALEKQPEDIEAANTCMRALHTIKGTAGCLGLQGISELAHKLESLLRRIRSREIRCTASHANLALRSLDMVKGLVKNVEDALCRRPMRRPEGYEAMLESLASPEVQKEPSARPRLASNEDRSRPASVEEETRTMSETWIACSTPQRESS